MKKYILFFILATAQYIIVTMEPKKEVIDSSFLNINGSVITRQVSHITYTRLNNGKELLTKEDIQKMQFYNFFRYPCSCSQQNEIKCHAINADPITLDHETFLDFLIKNKETSLKHLKHEIFDAIIQNSFNIFCALRKVIPWLCCNEKTHACHYLRSIIRYTGNLIQKHNNHYSNEAKITALSMHDTSLCMYVSILFNEGKFDYSVLDYKKIKKTVATLDSIYFPKLKTMLIKLTSNSQKALLFYPPSPNEKVSCV